MSRIKYLVMDVDGTLTDGKIYMGQSGELMKAFSAKDGYGINVIARKAGIIPVIITGRKSDIVMNRCGRELKISEIHQGIDDKTAKLAEILEQNGDTMAQTAYIGDDMNDYDCMLAVKNGGGLVGCPEDAVKEVKEIADFISPHIGGSGAVRDFVEWLVDIK